MAMYDAVVTDKTMTFTVGGHLFVHANFAHDRGHNHGFTSSGYRGRVRS